MSKETQVLLEPETRSYRLPRTVVPERYEIQLEPDLNNFTFAGEETVHIIVAEPVKEILLNALDLTIEEARIENGRGHSQVAKISLDVENERARLSFDQVLKSGLWTLHLRFRGTISEQLRGFYKSTYKDASGQTKKIATTQFQTTEARRAFPCWDEPDFKAVYSVTLIVDENLVAISNTSIESEKRLPKRDKKEVVFHDTIKMSTYLVAFIIGEFEGTEPVKVDGTPIRIWAPPGNRHLTKFAENLAAFTLSFFNNYYGLKYPGDKLDFIVIPDFAFGGMENLGAITFRDTALLVDEKMATHAELERVADVVAHEIAHMWFGDLATMKWWNGIWLNEAFATFMSMLAVNAWKPEWKRWESFGAFRAEAFSTDSLRSTRTIESPVNHPNEAQGMFDVLTYKKGAAILRMLEQYLEPEVFRRGIGLYLSKHKYDNTETTDLWDAIEESSKQPVREMMDTWIYQEGHPLISANLDASGKTLTLSQQRFMYAAEGQNDNDQKETLFHVPIMLKAKTAKGTVTKRVLLTSKSIDVKFEDKVESVVLNEGGHGFYRVRYSQPLLKALTANLTGSLSAIERFNLVNDSWAAVLAGLQPLADYLDLARLFSGETDKNVWSVLISSMQYLDSIDAKNDALKQFVREICGPALKSLTWKPKSKDDAVTKQLRGMLISVMGTTGFDKEIQSQAKELYVKYKSRKSSVTPDIVPALVNVLAHTGSEERYQEFARDFENAATPQEYDRYMYSLANFSDKSLIERTLNKTINGEIRTANGPYIVRTAMMNKAGRELSWQFMTANWQTIGKLFPKDTIAKMCEGITALTTEELLGQTRQFFSANPVMPGKKLVEQHIEKQAVAVALRKREAKTLQSFDH
jgi:puromycin-sensitive aminopeptidase